MAELLLGIDVGTYSTKGVITTPSGEIIAETSTPHSMAVPRPGWAEHDPDSVWWEDFVEVSNTLLAQARVGGEDIAAVGASGIGPCMLPVDREGRPLRDAVLYGVDTRATAEVGHLNEVIGVEEIRSLGGMDLSSQAIGPKILWLRRHEPDTWAQTHKVLTASSYLVHRLTGEFVIDYHQGAHTLPMFDAASQSWTDRYADHVCDPDLLPALRWSDEVAGTVTSVAAEATGLAAGTPVSVGTVDALAEAVSVGVQTPGDLMVMYGSTAFFILFTPDQSFLEGGWALPGPFEETHVLAAGMATTGSLTRWFVDQFMAGDVDEAYVEIFAEAAAIVPGANGLVVLPYFSGERTPINDPDARGAMVGLSLAHTRGHVFRGVLEGIAYGVRHNIDAMRRVADVRRLVAVGGGTTGGLLPQIVSDVVGTRQAIPKHTTGAAYGNAFLAGTAEGGVQRTDLDEWAPIDHEIRPEERHRAVYDQGYEAFRALYPAIQPLLPSQDG